MSNEVKLLGKKENPYFYIHHSDVFIMTSISEGLPTALCEALILEKPCIVPDITGCREVTDNGKYALMINRDKKKSQAMLKMMTDKDFRVKFENKAIERSVLFDDKNTINKYLKLLTN